MSHKKNSKNGLEGKAPKGTNLWWRETVTVSVIMSAVIFMAVFVGISRIPNFSLIHFVQEKVGWTTELDKENSHPASERIGIDKGGVDENGNFSEGVYTFEFTSTRKGKAKHSDKVYYSDSFFEKSNSYYDHQIAKASLALAMSGFEFDNVKASLTELGYIDITSYRYDEKKDEDKAAVCFAHKDINGQQIISVCIRGGNYGNEWGSNGRLGKTGYHYGFHMAAEDALEQLVDYASVNGIELKTAKIWMTGFSRGAAVANVLGAKLKNDGIVKTDALYCYTFATPSTVSERVIKESEFDIYKMDTGGLLRADSASTGTGGLPGIYNVVNPLDIVTRLPMNASGSSKTKSGKNVEYHWDYVKYGATVQLPVDTADKSMQLAVKDVFSGITGGGSYEAKPSDIQVTELLEKAIAFSTRNDQHYVDKYQDDVIIPLFKRYMGSSSDSLSRGNVIVAVMDALPGVSTFIITELNELDFKARLYIGNMISGAEEQRLLKEHWPETYWAWMQAVSG